MGATCLFFFLLLACLESRDETPLESVHCCRGAQLSVLRGFTPRVIYYVPRQDAKKEKGRFSEANAVLFRRLPAPAPKVSPQFRCRVGGTETSLSTEVSTIGSASAHMQGSSKAESRNRSHLPR